MNAMLVQVDTNPSFVTAAARIGWKPGDPPALLQAAMTEDTAATLLDLVSVARIKARSAFWQGIPEPPIPEGYDRITVDGLTCYLLIDTDKWDTCYRMLVDVPESELAYGNILIAATVDE
jgi:hypothetical protein